MEDWRKKITSPRQIPITRRQSFREHALRICDYIKSLLIEGRFTITRKTEDLW